MIEVVEINQSNFGSLYIAGNVGIVGSVIHQTDGGSTYFNVKLLGNKVNSEIKLRDENSSSVNNVFIIILRTFNKVTTTTTRLLSEKSNRILETSSDYGTVYISDGKVTETGEASSFNWLLFIVIPACGLLAIILVIVFICCCCCKKEESEQIKAPKKEYAKESKPQESQRTIHDGSNRDVIQPIYMPSDRSLGGKPVPLESRKEIPKTVENSLLMDNSMNTPNRSRENSPDSHNPYNPDRTPERTFNMTPDRTPDMSPDKTPNRTPQDSPDRTPDKSPKRRRRRRREPNRDASQGRSDQNVPSRSPRRRYNE